MRVLIVEDESIVAMVAEHALLDNGHEVSGVAASEEEAYTLAAAEPPEVAVVDIRLKPGDGRDVAKRLHAEYGTRILFASGHASEVLPSQDFATGNYVFCLAKPYLPEELADSIRIMERVRAGGEPPERLPHSLLLLHVAA